MNKITTSLAISALLITLMGCQPAEQNEENKNVQINEIEQVEQSAEVQTINSQEKDYTYYFACENNQHPFRAFGENGESHGQFSFTGELMKVEDYTPFMEGENSMYARMKVYESNPTGAYDYFMAMANKGNSVNRIEDEALVFNIGTIENGELSSTAEMSEETKSKILNSLDSKEKITLNMTVPLYAGMGAPANFSFACKIE